MIVVASNQSSLLCCDNGSQMLSNLEPDCDRFPWFSSPSDCPSLSSSYSSFDTSVVGPSHHRRLSFASSDSSTSPEVFSVSSAGTASPSTPMTAIPFSTGSNEQYLKSGSKEFNIQPFYSFGGDDYDDGDALWAASTGRDESGLRMLNSFSSVQAAEMSHELPGLYQSTYYNVFLNNTANPSLSRPIFSDPLPSVRLQPADDDFLLWPSSITETPVQTIAPSATFHPILSTPPGIESDPAMHIASQGSSSLVLSSSPMTDCSPGILPSQHEYEDSPGFRSTALELTPSDVSRVRRATGRLVRRQYGRKGPFSATRNARVPSTKSGFECEVVISQNEFACGYRDCIDKSTGKQKRFKRQEHKKRHEKTVHERERHNQYKCWVPQCKTAPFSRTDNLKSHLQKTHGKRSANARNRYVATQDRNSDCYDPEWVGELTDEGYPVKMPVRSDS